VTITPTQLDYIYYSTGNNIQGLLGFGFPDTGPINTFQPLSGRFLRMHANNAMNRNQVYILSSDNITWLNCGIRKFGALAMGSSGEFLSALQPLSGTYDNIFHTGNTVYALSSGQLLCTGQNSAGALGQGNLQTIHSFVPIGNRNQYVDIKTNGVSTYLLSTNGITKDGMWAAAGRNAEGQLNINNLTNQTIFVEISGQRNGTSFTSLCVGGFAIYVLSAGKWFSCGDNAYGQLCIGDVTSLPNRRTLLTQMTGNWLNVIPGFYQLFALSADGQTWFGCGNNSSYQLGLGDNNIRYNMTQLSGNWIKFVSNLTYTLGLSTNGRWLVTGGSASGGNGLGDASQIVTTWTELSTKWDDMVTFSNCTWARIPSR